MAHLFLNFYCDYINMIPFQVHIGPTTLSKMIFDCLDSQKPHEFRFLQFGSKPHLDVVNQICTVWTLKSDFNGYFASLTTQHTMTKLNPEWQKCRGSRTLPCYHSNPCGYVWDVKTGKPDLIIANKSEDSHLNRSDLRNNSDYPVV